MLTHSEYLRQAFTLFSTLLCVTLLSAMLDTNVVLAQQGELKAVVSSNKVARNQNFQLTFEINGPNAKNFVAPDLSAFTVVQGPSTSNRVEYINGNMRQTQGVEYTLRSPNKAGTYTIPAAGISFGNTTVKSNPIKITVTNEDGNQAPNLDGEIFLRVSTNKREVYQGEQFYITYKLYSRYEGFSNYSTDQPDLSGFWVHEIEREERGGKIEELDGVRYVVHTLKEAILVPQRSGKLSLDPMTFETNVRVRVQGNSRRRGGFADLFGGGRYQDVRHKTSSKAIAINVKPLPANAKPTAFTGAVGDFDLETSVSSEATAVNEAITYRLTIEGKGNISLLGEPDIKFPNVFEVYDPRLVEDVKVAGGKLGGRRTFEYLLIPRTPGDYKISPVEFAWFDPATERYLTRTSPEYQISVARGDGDGAAAISQGVRREEVELLADDIRFIKTSASGLGAASRLPGSALFFALLAAPVIGLLLTFVIAKRRDSQSEDSPGRRSSAANKVARKRLGVAKQALSAGKEQIAFEEISKALWGYLGDKLGLDAAQLSQDTAREAMRQRNVPPETADGVLSVIQKCELARFAPGAVGASAQQVYQEAIDLITSLEGALR